MKLIRGLSFWDALSLVVGSMIGTGVFLKSAKMAQLVPSPFLVLSAWVVAGVLSLMGALTYSEMGRRYSDAGGEYVYLREGYNSFFGFLYGWTRFWVASPGSVAAYGVGAATFLSGVLDLHAFGGRVPVALLFIFTFTILNCLKVSFGGKLQLVLTSIKVLCLVFITVGVFAMAGGTFKNLELASHTVIFGWNAFGAAVLSALWAFDGWNNLPMAAGEVKNAERSVPLALLVGTFLVLGIYLTVNAAYFFALPFNEVATSSSTQFPLAAPVALKAIQSFWSGPGSVFLSLLFVISALGAMNGSILTGARVPYAMAKDHLFFQSFERLHPQTAVPFVAVIVEGLIAMVLAVSGTFDQLTDCVIFASWIFYALIALSVFRLPVKKAYRAIALLFTLSALVLLLNTLISNPKESALGLLIVLLGVPAYFFYKRANRVEPSWQRA